MRETIRYWFRCFFWQTAQAALIVIAVMAAVFLARVDFSQGGISPYLMPMVITFSTILANVLTGIGAHTLFMPLQLAFGETRQRIFWGYMGGLVFYAAASTAAAGIVLALSAGLPACLPPLPGAFFAQLAASGFSCLLGVVYTRFKLVGTFIIAACSSVVGGGFVSIVMLDPISTRFSLDFLEQGWVLGILAAVAAALLIVGGGLTYLRLRRLEVKL